MNRKVTVVGGAGNVGGIPFDGPGRFDYFTKRSSEGAGCLWTN